MGSMSVGHVGQAQPGGGGRQARTRAGGAHTSRALTPGAKGGRGGGGENVGAV